MNFEPQNMICSETKRHLKHFQFQPRPTLIKLFFCVVYANISVNSFISLSVPMSNDVVNCAVNRFFRNLWQFVYIFD
jgi:hypothetical protein